MNKNYDIAGLIEYFTSYLGKHVEHNGLYQNGTEHSRNITESIRNLAEAQYYLSGGSPISLEKK